MATTPIKTTLSQEAVEVVKQEKDTASSIFKSLGLGIPLDSIKLQAILLTQANNFNTHYSVRTDNSGLFRSLLWVMDSLGVKYKIENSYSSTHQVVSVFHTTPLLSDEDLLWLDGVEAKLFLSLANKNKLSPEVVKHLEEVATTED